MAVPIARVHLAMAHASLPGLLPTPPRCMMFPLLPAPPCATILPSNSSPKPSRADAAGRWDAHKIGPAAGSPASSSSSLSSCDTRESNKKSVMLTSSPSRTSPAARISNGNSRADSVERWDAHKTPASPASSSSSSASSNKTKTWHISRRPNSNAPSSSAERWDAHKKARAPQRAGELDDGESSTGSNDVKLDAPLQQLPPRSFYAGPGFITAPEPSMLPKPSFMIRVA